MMTNQNPTQGYESGILQQLIKNSESTAIVQFKVEQIEEEFKKVNNKIEQIEEEFKKVNNKIEQINTRLDSVEGKLSNLETIAKDIGFAKWILGTIALGVFINLLSSPIVGLFG
jgi:septal ring factor EnvC (AmiA/AmiB activator)